MLTVVPGQGGPSRGRRRCGGRGLGAGGGGRVGGGDGVYTAAAAGVVVQTPAHAVRPGVVQCCVSVPVLHLGVAVGVAQQQLNYSAVPATAGAHQSRRPARRVPAVAVWQCLTDT